MANEVQQVEADLRKASTKIENLEARLEGLPADAPAAEKSYLQDRICVLYKKEEQLRTEKEQLRRKEELLLLQRVQGMGLIGNISNLSQVRLGCWRSPVRIRKQVVYSFSELAGNVCLSGCLS